MKRAFEEDVKLGMDKDQVLEAIGGPRAVTRFHGKDRWFIAFYHDNIRYEKEVHFTEGKATYVGEPYEPPPELSAKAVDRRNEEANLRTYEDLVKARQAADVSQETYEKQVRGEDKVRIVPQFEPIK